LPNVPAFILKLVMAKWAAIVWQGRRFHLIKLNKLVSI
jgi:hypothetical protein